MFEDKVDASRTAPDYKAHFFQMMLSRAARRGGRVRILEYGCGDARTAAQVLPNHPTVEYVGVEQRRSSAEAAMVALEGIANCEIRVGFGEQFAEHEAFDLVLSLSVLEHVKRRSQFLRASVMAARPGGLVAHRYDLGHAVSPSTLGERVKVSVATRYPVIVPASAFTSYVSLEETVESLRDSGLTNISVQRSQIPGLKKALAGVPLHDRAEVASQIFELEDALWRHLRVGTSAIDLDRIFPTVAIMGQRGG